MLKRLTILTAAMTIITASICHAGTSATSGNGRYQMIVTEKEGKITEWIILDTETGAWEHYKNESTTYSVKGWKFGTLKDRSDSEKVQRANVLRLEK